jgi:transcription termination factor Rho
MSVLERSELEASPLADLHAIADQLGLDGYRRLRKAELIDAILGDAGSGAKPAAPTRPAAQRERRRAQRPRARARAETASTESRSGVAEGVVELLDNGSAFLRVAPPDPSNEDVYISPAQVRRCELVSGDRVSGTVRTPRRSERHPALVRIDTINGAPADAASDPAGYEELPVAYPLERLELRSSDPTLEAIEWLTPLGRGSRAVIVGAARAGKTETLRRLLGAIADREDLEVTLVLVGARPEEIAQWQEGPVRPAAALSFAASADAQGRAVEEATDSAKRVCARGGNALVLIDSLDGLHPQAARKALVAARNLRDGGSLTLIATATRPFGGETTVISLDVALASTGREPILDLVNSNTLKAELLVGEDGAEAIVRARAAALEAAR